MEEKLKDIEKEKVCEQAVMKEQVSVSCQELKNLKDEHEKEMKKVYKVSSEN